MTEFRLRLRAGCVRFALRNDVLASRLVLSHGNRRETINHSRFPWEFLRNQPTLTDRQNPTSNHRQVQRERTSEPTNGQM